MNELAKVIWYYDLGSISEKKICCPLHGDINPSLSLFYEENKWFCFGCNQGGDAQKFVTLLEKKYNGLNDLQSCKKYHEILKSDKCKKIKIECCERKTKKQNRQLYIEAYDYFHGLKAVNWSDSQEPEVLEVKKYMLSRGFSAESLKKVNAKITYNNSYGLIFPIMDNGKFKGWVCRTTVKEIEQKRKYLYNTGFSRANTVVGNYGSEKYVIIVEGYMDMLKFLQFGVDNVCAIFGWKMSDNQFKKLKASGIKFVISALDNDECGKKGTVYLKKIFGEENVIRFSYLKGFKDVGEMSEKPFRRMFKKTMEKVMLRKV